MSAKLGLVRRDQARERLVVARLGSLEQLAVGVHRFGAQSATSPASGLETTLRHPDGPLAVRAARPLRAPARARSTSRPGRPRRTGARAAAACRTRRPRHPPCARVERQVRAGRRSDELRAPVQQLGVEGARAHLIGCVELEMHDRPGRRARVTLGSPSLHAFVTRSRTRRAGGSRAASPRPRRGPSVRGRGSGSSP